MSERFYWVVLGFNTRDKPQVALVCDEDSLPDAQEKAEMLCGRVEKLPVSFHESVPDLAAVEEAIRQMYLLLWGAPDAPGPGKYMGKQARLREWSLSAMRALGLMKGRAE